MRDRGVRAWPFLVSRHQHSDYMTVVAPDFMVEAKRASLLADVVRTQISQRFVDDEVVGPLLVVYRSVSATADGIPLKDRIGRPVILVGVGEYLETLANRPARGVGQQEKGAVEDTAAVVNIHSDAEITRVPDRRSIQGGIFEESPAGCVFHDLATNGPIDRAGHRVACC